MEKLEEKLGYTFRDRSLLENALTHSSYANENKALGLQSNERLEFLGDSVLGMVTADYLFRTHPDLPGGPDPHPGRSGLRGQPGGGGPPAGAGPYLKLGKGRGRGGRPGAALHRGRRGGGGAAAVYLDGGIGSRRRSFRSLFWTGKRKRAAAAGLQNRPPGAGPAGERTGADLPAHRPHAPTTRRSSR